MHDLVIRQAAVVDGTGAPTLRGMDIAIDAGRITAVERTVGGRGRREIDADGLLVTPGFVDVHTHYDGQVTWDPLLSPSCWHGVTTVVAGNCGVGFAPARPDRHEWLIELMEGVEDIPGAALAEGITWEWESFPEYLDALDNRPRALDFATQVPHGPLRAYVMGDRGARNEPATSEDVAAMASLVSEGIRAGALGFSTSRTLFHRALDGEPVPGTFADEDELLALASAVAAGGGGVIEVASDVGVGGMEGDFKEDLQHLVRMVRQTGLTVLYTLIQTDERPDEWRELLAATEGVCQGDGRLIPMVAGRPSGLLLGFETSLHPFKGHPTFRTLEDLAPGDRVRELRRPEIRAAILAETSPFKNRLGKLVAHAFTKMYPLGERPNYEPEPEESVAVLAAAAGKDPYAFAYDVMLERDGRGLLFFPLNDFAEGNLDAILERLRHPSSMLSLADGGAHSRLICDASTSTYMLSYWARDRRRGERMSVEEAVRIQTTRTAAVYGLLDRGVVKPGYRADLNVIDFEALGVEAPYMAYDLPADGPRLLQHATGYTATICNGQVTFENGEWTGALPGGLVRGPRPKPADLR